MDVCVTANGHVVTPSVNVVSVGDTGHTCTIALEIWDDAGHRLDTTSPDAAQRCGTGTLTETPLDLSTLAGVTPHTAQDGSLTAHPFARLTVDGQRFYTPNQGDSRPRPGRSRNTIR